MKYLRYMLWGIVCTLVVAFIALGLPQGQTSKNADIPRPPAGYNQGKPFTLTDQNGDIYNSNDKITEWHYALIFFGFTNCPAICPTELQKFALVMDDLPQDIAEKVTPLFITIDPERDTVDAMQSYVPQFHPSIIGLTGTPEQTQQVLSDWKVYAARVDDPQYTDYTMDHSTYSYLVDSDMNILALFRLSDNATKISQVVKKIVN